MDVVKDQYYPMGNYDDQSMRWTTLYEKWDQIVPKFKNTFHTLHTKLGIKDSEWHPVLEYHEALHRYIQTEMDFLDISSLGATYRYVVKIELKIKQHNKREFRYENMNQPKYGKYDPNSQNDQPQYKESKPQQNKGNGKVKKDPGKWCDFHKIPWHNTDECR